MSMPLRTFENLISPLKSSIFFDQYFDHAPLVLQDRPRDCFDSILTVSDIADHIDRNASPDGIDVMQAGQGVPLENWTRPHPNLSGEHLVDTERLFALIVQGYSVRLNGVHHKIPNLRDFCIALETDLQMPTHANLYITPTGQPALSPHYDTHDIFVLQLNGTKTWNFYGRPVISPSEQQPFTSQDLTLPPPSKTIDVRPGDLIYLPRGLVHSAETSQGVSVHLALGLKAPLLGDVAQAIAHRLWDNPDMRRAIPHGYSSKTEAAQVIDVLAQAMAEETTPGRLKSALNDVASASQSEHLPARQTDFRLIMSGLLRPSKATESGQSNGQPGND